MKKKMLIIIDTIKPMIDGVSIFLDNILPTLQNHYHITIIAPDYGTYTYENITMIKFPIRHLMNRDYGISKINRKIIKKQVHTCDLIFNHESISPFSASFYAALYAKKYQKPFYTYLHSLDWELLTETFHLLPPLRSIAKYLLKIYGKWYLQQCTAVIVASPSITTILKNNKITGNFQTAPVGITNDFKPGPSQFSKPNKIVIGYTGRISREKGIQTLLNVFNSLNTKHNNLFLYLVGGGPERSTIQKQENIQITGFISQKDVAEYLKAMDIYILPSITETSSISTLEAMKTGLCCITRNIGGIRDYIQHGHNGYFFTNEQDLLKIVEELITNPQLRKKISTNAQNTVTHYSWNATTEALNTIFKKYS